MKRKQFINNISFRGKISIIYIFCIILPLVLVSTFYYVSSVQKARNKNVSELKHSVNMAYSSINNLFDEVIMISDLLYNNSNLYKLLDTGNVSGSEKITVAREIDDIIKMFYVNNIIYDIKLYTENENLYSSECVVAANRPSNIKIFPEEFLQENTNVKVYAKYVDTMGQYLISYVRKLNNYAFQNGGVVLRIDINPKMIYDILYANSDKSTLYLFNDKGDPLYYGAGIDIKTLDKEEYIEEKYILEKFSFPDGYYLYATEKFVNTGIFSNTERNIFVALIIFIVVFSFIIMYIVTGAFTDKLSELTECMKKLRNGEFVSVSEENTGKDEIGVLTHGMNKTVFEIKNLIESLQYAQEKQIAAEREKNKAILKTLNSNVNPHFMFNVIEAVHLSTYKKGDYETATVMKHMAKMFRRLLSWKEDMTTVETELEFVNAYIEVQKYKLKNKIDILYEIDKDVLSAIIPKMIIQVLVENAFVHGVESREESRKMKLRIKRENEFVNITVADNGAGIDEQLIKAIIEDRISEIKPNSEGLNNVIKRLKIYFDDEVHVDISSKSYEWTEITIRFPYKEKTDFGEEKVC